MPLKGKVEFLTADLFIFLDEALFHASVVVVFITH